MWKRPASSSEEQALTAFKRALAAEKEELHPSTSLDTTQSRPGETLKVALLAKKWWSSKDGSSTINRTLAIHLAKHSIVQITLLVPEFEFSEEDKRIAQSHNISVREAQHRPGFSPLDWLSFPPRDLTIDIVIGHGVKLGRQAQVIRETHGCKWVQVVHTQPQDLSKYKNYSGAIVKGEEKYKTEVDLCELADLVVAVGPKLAQVFSVFLRSSHQDVFQLTPGTFADFADANHSKWETPKFMVLTFGHGDSEDLSLKGYDIAASAIVELKDSSYCLIFVGVPDGKQEEVAETLLQTGISKNQLIVRSSVPNKEILKALFCEVDVVIMPSRTEEFSLTALEAMSAGLPILVSRNSWFGEALRGLPFGMSSVIESADPKEWAKGIAGIRQKSRTLRLQEIKTLRRSYEEKFDWERQCISLVDRMSELVYVPEYILARGEIATAAYQRALKLGEASDKRVKVLLVGQDRVGKTSVGRSLKGEEFKEDESSTEGVQMDEALKNVGSEPWSNCIEGNEMTAFDHKCALFISNALTTSPEFKFKSQDSAIAPVGFEKGIVEEMAHLGSIEPSKAPSANTPEISNPKSKHEIPKVSLLEEEKPKVVIPDRIARQVNENLTKKRGDGDDGIWPVITDFAGQAIYRAIHPIFLSSEAIYVLMFDLTKNLHEIAQCHVREPGHGEIHIQAPDSNDTNLDHILRWMDQVNSYKHGGDDNILPPVILVGTKADLVADPDEIIESLTDTICETTQVFSEHIKERIAVDNTRAGRPLGKEDPNIVKLRNEILKVGEEMPHTKKKVPLKWLQVENKVDELASNGENYITRQNFKKNICDDICQFEPADDFEVLLLFLHDRGTVIYHGYASDPDCLVVLNPKWLIDILCQLITVEKQAKEPIRIRNLRKKLGKSGVLKAELLDHSCKSLGVANIKDSLLFIMKKFNLLCEYNGKDGNTIYLVPCMLTSEPEVNLVSSIDENEGPAPVFLTFNTQYVPGGLFSRLIVLFVEFASRITDCAQPELCSNFARFFLGVVTGVEFVCYKRVIKVSIWNYTNLNSDPLDKEPQICLELLSFLQDSLEMLQKQCHWMQAVTWDLSARCNLCTAEFVTETGECLWHRNKSCRLEDCAHFVSLTKMPTVCSRTKERTCCPSKTWSQALKDTLALQALEKQPRQFVNQRRYEQAGRVSPSTSLQDSVPHGEDIPSNQVLNKVARDICKDWQNLGLELKVLDSKIQEISVNNVLYPTVQQKAYQMLKAWKNRGESVTYDELCRALNELGLNELAKSLLTM